MKRRSSTSRSSRRGVAVDDAEELSVLLAQTVCLTLEHELEVAANRCQRRAQLVRHERDEVVLHGAELAKLFVCRLLPLESRLLPRLGVLERSDVSQIALDVEGLVVFAGNDDRVISDPHDASVGMHDAELLRRIRPRRVAGFPCSPRRFHGRPDG